MIILVFIGIFSLTMNGRMSHDEHMYISAGVLSEHQILYKDFAYLQMPYLPLLYGAIYNLTDTSHYLLFGRLLKCIMIILSAVLIYAISFEFQKIL